MLNKLEKTCESVGCALRGFADESLPDGEIQIKIRARHNGEWHVKQLNLAEMAVQRIKRDKRFAKRFNELLAA